MARGYSVYKHPPTHPADMIIENPNKRFVSDIEKETWNNKVDKVEGKGLSTEDYTTEEKEKLARIEENANNFIVNNAVGIKDKIVTGVILLMKDENGYYMRADGLGNHMLCYSENGYFAFPLTFVSEEEKTKLSNIADGATKVESSAINGNIVINGQEKVVYTHPTNAGNKHIPSGGSTNQYLKYGGSSGTAQWAKISADDIETTTDKQFISQSEKTKLSGIADGATKVEVSSTNGYIKINGVESKVYEIVDGSVSTNKIANGAITDPKIGNRTVNDTITTSYSNTGTLTTILSWFAKMLKTITGKSNWYTAPSINLEQTYSHTQNSSIHMSSAEKTKLSNIADGATKVESSTINGNIKINGAESKVYEHPNVHHLPTSGGGSGAYLKYAENGGGIWSEINANDIATNQNKTFVSEAEKAVWNAKQDALGFIPVDSTTKNQPNGYLGLNPDGKFDESMGMRYGAWVVPPSLTTIQITNLAPKNIFINSVTDIINYGSNSDVVEGTEFLIYNKTNSNIGVFSVQGGYPSWVVPAGNVLRMVRTQTGWEYTNIPTQLHNAFEKTANKGEANGYAPLDNDKLIPAQYIPPNALSQSYANPFVATTEGSSIAVSDVQEYTNARSLIIDGKTVEEPIKNLIPEASLKFEQAGTYSWRIHAGASVVITQNQVVTEWGSETATRIQISGGNDKKKYYCETPRYYPGSAKFAIKIKIKNIGTAPLIISDFNDNIIDQISPNEVKFVDTIYTGNSFALVFASQNISDNLDFYAEDPFVAVFDKSVDSPHQILGVGESGNITTIVNGETVYETTLPAPLYALSDSKKDYVDITEGKIYKITNKIVCDGSENWGLTSSQPSDNSLVRFGIIRSNFASQALGIYSHGDWFGGNMFLSRPEGAGVSSTQIVVHIAKSRISGWDDSLTSTQKVSLFKNWLSAQALIGQPVTFVYELATPTVTDITPQTVPLYAPTTNITTNDELQPTIRLTYNRDSNEVIADLQNQINQLKSALALL